MLPKRSGFSLVGLLLTLALFLAAASSLLVALPAESEEALVRRDMARLERWLASAMLRSGRWKCAFTLRIVMPQSTSSRHYMSLRWQDGSLALQKNETFYAARGVKWRMQGNVSSATYQWNTHTMSPAFTLSALNSRGKQTGDTLVVSLRGQITRRSDGKIM
ncbi:MAG: hypothetical protein J6Z30_07825 [Pyramidobacter sp.]|nr:hypothetical protein [Pyramidobacter sp.]